MIKFCQIILLVKFQLSLSLTLHAPSTPPPEAAETTPQQQQFLQDNFLSISENRIPVETIIADQHDVDEVQIEIEDGDTVTYCEPEAYPGSTKSEEVRKALEAEVLAEEEESAALDR